MPEIAGMKASTKPSIHRFEMGNVLRFFVAGIVVSIVGALAAWVMSILNVQVAGVKDLLGLPNRFFSQPFSVFYAHTDWASGITQAVYQVAAFAIVVTALGCLYSWVYGKIEDKVPYLG